MESMLQYLLDTAPLSDRDCYSTKMLESFARHGAFLRREIPWCRELPEELFRCYVLYHRVNDEDISDHRKLFFDLLYPRVKNLTVEEAIQETNRWCHEHATYRLQDDRTAAPLTVFKAGSGRCGEESTFLVSALRSIGIAARQVYVPRWSHCDDNHAWVEAYANGTWYFLGGCEPEPTLNAGCFNQTSSRAMLIHSRLFSQRSAEKEEALDTRGCVTWYNQIRRYAKTKRYTIQVEQEGKPARGAEIRLEMLNEARMIPVCTLIADEKGQASVEMGLGDMHITAWKEGKYAEGLLKGMETNRVKLELGRMDESPWRTFAFEAPRALPVNPLKLDDEQRKQREETLKKGNDIRQKRLNAFWNAEKARKYPQAADLLQAAYGNFQEIYDFLSRDENPLREKLLRTLAVKDLRDSKAEMLEDHLRFASPYARAFEEDLFLSYVLCPRIAWEYLTPWRGKLAACFTEQERRAFCQNPRLLWQRLRDAVEIQTAQIYENLYWPPDAAMEKKRCDERSLRVLLVALLRSWGIPARLNPADEWTPEFWREGSFVSIEEKRNGTLIFCREEGERAAYGKDWSVERWENGQWRPLKGEENPWRENRCSLEQPQGLYRVTTAFRKQNGSQLGAVRHVNLQAGETREIRLLMQETEEEVPQVRLPDFTAPARKENAPWMMCWTVPGEEPTERILGELLLAKPTLTALNTAVTVYSKGGSSSALEALKKNWPEAKIIEGQGWNEKMNEISACFDYDPQMPPLAVAAASSGKLIYADGGFNAGCIELMARTLVKNEKR